MPCGPTPLPGTGNSLIFGCGGSGAMRDILAEMMSSCSSTPALCECHRPFVLARPTTAAPATPERELSLANTVGELDAGNRDRRVLERLEPRHRCTASLDRPMILLVGRDEP